MNSEIFDGSVTSPKGFRADGLHCGLKDEKPDLALIVSDTPAAAAALFTTSSLAAAPVVLCKKQIDSGVAQAILINSGNANACTGEQGMQDARQMIQWTAKALHLVPDTILIASTGVIGHYLPMGIIRNGIARITSSLAINGGERAAEAIMTTDTRPKHRAITFDLQGVPVSIGAIAKGSGMIQPNMATMICIVTTDIAIKAHLLKNALKRVVNGTLNALTIDGEMSTNDCFLALANGQSGAPKIESKNADYETFEKALHQLLLEMTLLLARDGEGATKVITITVREASSEQDAKKAARAIANSMLVKTALYGQDPNWGRIVSAVGSTGIRIDPNGFEIKIAGINVARDGCAIEYDEKKMQHALAETELSIDISLNCGSFTSQVYTCDLTHEYITINAEYHT
ncbi:bifunctional glutamate N-acetyltransferase/amino-acid acetyltransferase ArgJ [candidate division KSB1 bacterium]|nr:bifunctional glutamate N-acetyltransferase/amino-acid acetyltransferase ArgJ [candidate division KSB1 bacterium]